MVFHVLDYVVLCSTFAMSFAVGLYFGFSSGRSTKSLDYLLANRQMGVLPVAFSIGATIITGSSMVGVVGEVYMYGWQYLFFAFGATIGILVSSIFVIPVYMRIEYISIYEYVERRFHKFMRVLFSIIYIIARMMFMTVTLYIPAISLSTLTPFPEWAAVLVSGCICVAYCVLGGIRAVIWSDFLQACLMLIAYALIITFGIVKVGGIETVWNRNVEGLRIGHPTYVEDERTRYSMWSLTFNGMIILMNTMCASQAGIQRVLCVSNLRKGQRATFIGAAIVFSFLLLTVITSLVVFANFAYCDPKTTVDIKKVDQILLYGIGRILGHIPGLQGLALAGIFSGSLSTFSSYLNSFSTITIEDFVLKKWKLSEKLKLTMCKLLTLIYGLVCVSLTFLVPLLGGIMRTCIFVLGSTGGPMTAVIFLGIFIRKANFKGSLTGLLTGLVLCLWMAIGSSLHKINYHHLPLSTKGCSNFTSRVIVSNRSTTNIPPIDDPFILYTISFMWYGPIGFAVTFLTGYVISLFTGSENTVDPRLLSPLLQKSSIYNLRNENVKETSCLKLESPSVEENEQL